MIHIKRWAGSEEFELSVSDDARRIAELERANADLTASLRRCRALVSAYHAKLAANCNHVEPSGSARAGAIERPRGAVGSPSA